MSIHTRSTLTTTTLLLVLMLTGVASAVAAADEEAAVVGVVQRFFDAMAAKDVKAFRATMMPNAVVHSSVESPERPPIRSRSAAEDAEWLATSTDTLLERMWDPDVRVRGRIAVLWTPYDFWRNGAFSHCGVDIFTLVKTSEGWKISSAVYTVEREGCAPSPLGPPTEEQLHPRGRGN